MKKLAPWTWSEIAHLERERGPAMEAFVKAYGLRGMLALELSRVTGTMRSCVIRTYPGCIGCPMYEVAYSCAPWGVSRQRMIDAYAAELEKHGRMPQ